MSPITSMVSSIGNLKKHLLAAKRIKYASTTTNKTKISVELATCKWRMRGTTTLTLWTTPNQWPTATSRAYGKSLPKPTSKPRSKSNTQPTSRQPTQLSLSTTKTSSVAIRMLRNGVPAVALHGSSVSQKPISSNQVTPTILIMLATDLFPATTTWPIMPATPQPT